MRLNHPTEGFPWDDLRKIFSECQRTAKVPNSEENIAENFNRLSRAHAARTLQTDRQTDGRAIAYSERELTLTFAKNYCSSSSSIEAQVVQTLTNETLK